MVKRVSARLGILWQTTEALRGEPTHHRLFNILIRLADHVRHDRPTLGRSHQEPHGRHRRLAPPFVSRLPVISDKMKIATADKKMALFGLVATHRGLPHFGAENPARPKSNLGTTKFGFAARNMQ